MTFHFDRIYSCFNICNNRNNVLQIHFNALQRSFIYKINNFDCRLNTVEHRTLLSITDILDLFSVFTGHISHAEQCCLLETIIISFRSHRPSTNISAHPNQTSYTYDLVWAVQCIRIWLCVVVFRGLPVQNTNDVSCFVVNYAGFPECWLNRDSIYSSRNMMWEQVWLMGINGMHCSKANRVLILQGKKDSLDTLRVFQSRTNQCRDFSTINGPTAFDSGLF